MSEADLAARLAEKEAVIARIKEHVGVWKNDARMRLSAEILLGHIARIEKEEEERTRKGR